MTQPEKKIATQVFAVIKLNVPVAGPDGKIAGHNVKEITKCFGTDQSTEDIRSWVLASGAKGCTVWFETEEN